MSTFHSVTLHSDSTTSGRHSPRGTAMRRPLARAIAKQPDGAGRDATGSGTSRPGMSASPILIIGQFIPQPRVRMASSSQVERGRVAVFGSWRRACYTPEALTSALTCRPSSDFSSSGASTRSRCGWPRSCCRGSRFSGPEALLLAGLAFGVVNTFLKPILFILTLPITFVTLGLFVLVLNTLILFLVAWLVPGFTVGTFWQAFFAALFISFFSFLLNLMLRGKVVRIKIDRSIDK